MRKILVTGGAGYIGSHAVRQLLESGYSPIVIDNLYSGNKWSVPSDVPFYKGDMADQNLVRRIFKEHKIQDVIHFAAHLAAGESVQNPIKYYRNNVYGTMQFLEICMENKIKNFIFSSTAATYGTGDGKPVSESYPTRPENPYGKSKLFAENIIQDLAKIHNFKFMILRYFNVVGARVDNELGQATPNSQILLKVACETLVGKRDLLTINGDNYPTPDGTCIRDYIHVEDLVQAHLLALKKLDEEVPSQILNLGYGKGYSVKDVIQTLEKVSGKIVNKKFGPRREGDPVEIVADSSKAQKVLGWVPKYNDLDLICKTAYDWEVKLNARK